MFKERIYQGKEQMSVVEWKNAVCSRGAFITDASALRREIFTKAGVAYSDEDKSQKQN